MAHNDFKEKPKYTLTQRILRPVINFLVETFFPHQVFYGREYLALYRNVMSKGQPDEEVLMFEGASKVMIAAAHQTLKDFEGDSLKVTIEDINYLGHDLGDWDVSVSPSKK